MRAYAIYFLMMIGGNGSQGCSGNGGEDGEGVVMLFSCMTMNKPDAFKVFHLSCGELQALSECARVFVAHVHAHAASRARTL